MTEEKAETESVNFKQKAKSMKKKCVRRFFKEIVILSPSYLTLRNIGCEDRLTRSGRNRCYANEFSPFESTTPFKLCAGDFPSR